MPSQTLRDCIQDIDLLIEEVEFMTRSLNIMIDMHSDDAGDGGIWSALNSNDRVYSLFSKVTKSYKGLRYVRKRLRKGRGAMESDLYSRKVSEFIDIRPAFYDLVTICNELSKERCRNH